jgi:glutamyl/glutaminyl-tRNA synthetase
MNHIKKFNENVNESIANKITYEKLLKDNPNAIIVNSDYKSFINNLGEFTINQNYKIEIHPTNKPYFISDKYIIWDKYVSLLFERNDDSLIAIIYNRGYSKPIIFKNTIIISGDDSIVAYDVVSNEYITQSLR